MSVGFVGEVDFPGRREVYRRVGGRRRSARDNVLSCRSRMTKKEEVVT